MSAAEKSRGWSINALAQELDIDRRSLRRRLESVAPIGQGPRGPLFALRDALAALERDPVVLRAPAASPRSSGKCDVVEAFLIGRPGPCATVSGAEVLALHGWSGWDDLAEMLGWGAPFAEAGRSGAPASWRFAMPHVARWVQGVCSTLGWRDAADLPARLRRERAGRECFVPSGFKPYDFGSRAA